MKQFLPRDKNGRINWPSWILPIVLVLAAMMVLRSTLSEARQLRLTYSEFRESTRE